MLTESQKKLVEDNYGLVYAYCHLHRLEDDEFIGMLSIKLCEIIPKYSSEQGTMGCFVYKSFDNFMKNWLIGLETDKRKANNSALYLNDDDKFINIVDSRESMKNVEDRMLIQSIVSYVQHRIETETVDKKRRRFEFLFHHILGETNAQIAKKYNIGEGVVQSNIKIVQKELRDEYAAYL